MADVILDERLAERRREVRRDRKRSRLRRTIAAVVVALLASAGYAAERSGLVALEEIRVTGTERTTEAEILEAAALELGTSTVRLRLADAETRVEQLPLVADAQLRRVDPLTVQIDVVERRPAVVVHAGTGRSLLVDEEGLVLAGGSEPGLAVIELAAGGRVPEPGEELGAENEALANAHAVAVRLTGPIGALVDRYAAVGPRDVDLLLRDGRRVRFGAAERIDEKVRSLGAVLEDLGATDVSVIDVRAPGTPTVVRAP